MHTLDLCHVYFAKECIVDRVTDWTKRHPFAPPPGTPGIMARSSPAFAALAFDSAMET